MSHARRDGRAGSRGGEGERHARTTPSRRPQAVGVARRESRAYARPAASAASTASAASAAAAGAERAAAGENWNMT